MKKVVLSIAVLLITLFLLIGCSDKNLKTSEVSATPEPVITDEPTVVPTASPVPTPTPEPTPIPTPTPPPSSWEVDYFVDDFGDKTSDAYLRGTFKGKFSNSATSGSNLTVHFFYNGAYCTIRLLEYDSHKAAFSTRDDITFKFKVDGKEESIDLITLSYGDDLYFTSSDGGYYTLKKAFMDGKEIKCVIKGSLYGDTYNFTMDGIGFAETMKEAGMS